MATPPKGAKKPTDRRSKASSDGSHKVEVNGRAWTVSAEALDDFELLDDLGEIETGNAAPMPRVLKRLLGAEQYREALDSLRDPETGRVGVEAGADFVRAVFEELPQGNG